MMRFFLALGTLICFASPALAAAPTQTPSQVTVTLAPVRGSNQHGTAVLTQRGNELVVNVRMTMSNTGPLGAHIHRGTCPAPKKQPLYMLNSVTNGTSTTTLTSTNLSKLTSGDYTISVHKSATDTKNPIACGDIKSANPTATTQ